MCSRYYFASLLLLSLLPALLWGQYHRVYFTDKGGQDALLDTPEKLLSPRSLARRQRMDIPLGPSDLPVAPAYLNALEALDLEVAFASRWLNYALVEGTLPAEVPDWSQVRKVQTLSHQKGMTVAREKITASPKQMQQGLDYGLAKGQIEMLRGHLLHDSGHTGRGMVIAVLDGGFAGADTIGVLDSLHRQNRVLGTYSFVYDDTNVYRGGTHGTSVLSVMAALDPGRMVGTAPHAAYYLLNSEDGRSETPVEMDNWLAAAEYADSVGADVINSSLGYSEFDDSTDNFTYADMNGDVALVTRAADKAAQKGIAVVVSAGNAGSSSWQYITAPADGDSVLTVGAVNSQRDYVNFSSVGPTADGRIKPDVAAQGALSTLATGSGQVVAGFGTSFSAPIVAGLTACLLEAKPQSHAQEVLDVIRRSAHQYYQPDSLLGYGIPDFHQASLLGLEQLSAQTLPLKVYPTPFRQRLYLQVGAIARAMEVRIELSDLRGNRVYRSQSVIEPGGLLRIEPHLAEGLYLLRVNSEAGVYHQKIMRAGYGK